MQRPSRFERSSREQLEALEPTRRSRCELFTVGAGFFGGPSGPTGLLDGYTSGLWAACALVRLIGSYGLGPAITVRRSSDNATQDINLLASGALDTTALSTFVGANSAFVTKWWDQSGFGNHFLQATAANQPRIVNAGTYDAKLVFNPTGTSGFMKTSATGGAVTAKSIFRKVNTRARNSNNVNFEYGDGALLATGSGSNQIQLDDGNSSGTQMGLYLATDSGAGYFVCIHNTVSETGVPNGCIIRKGGGNASASLNLYQAGALVTPSFSTTVGTVTETGNFPAYTWTIGARASSASFGAQIDMWSCVIYDADMATNANAINTALA